MSDDRIAIVGGGLSAIYSYFGTLDAGYHPEDVDVFVSGYPKTAGAVFMYDMPGNLPLMGVEIISMLVGTCDHYAYKQWHEEGISSAHTRFHNGSKPVVREFLWDPDACLPILWSMIPNVHQVPTLSIEDIDELKKQFDKVILTFPNIAKYSNAYRDCRVDIPIASFGASTKNYTVIYNGRADIPWVRQTTIPGHIMREYPHYVSMDWVKYYEESRGNQLGLFHVARDLKPDTIPLTWEERIEDNSLRVGRHAIYDRSYLSHQAREDVAIFLQR